jgi:hypothetical protein
MEFSKDIGQCVTNSEAILDNKIQFLEHVYENKKEIYEDVKDL